MTTRPDAQGGTPAGDRLPAWWGLIAGFVLWFAALCAVYGLHAWGCAAGWARGALTGTLLAMVLATLALLLALHRRWRARHRRCAAGGWLAPAVAGSLLAAAAATLFALGVPLLLTPCIG